MLSTVNDLTEWLLLVFVNLKNVILVVDWILELSLRWEGFHKSTKI